MKYYIRIPGGEIQYGVVSRNLTIWFRGKAYRIHKGRWTSERYEKLTHGKPGHMCNKDHRKDTVYERGVVKDATEKGKQ